MVEGVGGVPEAAEDVLAGELRVVLHDLVDGETFAQQPENGHDRDPGPAHARHTTHDLVVDHDAVHGPTVAAAGAPAKDSRPCRWRW